jgi:hypothetical protein
MQIVQLSEAAGWQAVYANKDADRQKRPYVVVPVACWGLVEETWDDGKTVEGRVVGFVPDGPDLDPAPCHGFLGYLAPEQNVDDYEALVEEFWSEQKEAADAAAAATEQN